MPINALRRVAGGLASVLAMAVVTAGAGYAPAAVTGPTEAGNLLAGRVPGVTVAAPGGRVTATVLARSGSRYLAVPVSALPQLGRGTDPRQFALTAPPRAGQASPHGRDVLTVTGTDLAGRPATSGGVSVGNVADENLGGDAGFNHGVARFHVGPGTYQATALFITPGRHGQPASVRIDVLAQFTVAGNTTVHTRAAAATSRISMVTPRPGRTVDRGVTIVRTAPHAPANVLSPLVSGFSLISDRQIYVSPVRRKPTDGTLHMYAWAQVTSPPGARIPYAYTLDFAAPLGRIPARQRYIVRRDSLAVVNESYYQDRRSAGCWREVYATLYQEDTSLVPIVCLPLRLPTRQVQYFSSNRPLRVQSQYYEYSSARFGEPPTGRTPGGQVSPEQVIHVGQHGTQSWNKYPLHPGANMSPPTPGLVEPSAARSGNILTLFITPFSDSQPGHIGDGLAVPTNGHPSQVSGRYAIYQDGTKIAGGDAVKASDSFFG